jgi:hypothetical protein
VHVVLTHVTILFRPHHPQPDGYREVDHDPLLPLLEGCVIRVIDDTDDDGFYYGNIEGAHTYTHTHTRTHTHTHAHAHTHTYTHTRTHSHTHTHTRFACAAPLR